MKSGEKLILGGLALYFLLKPKSPTIWMGGGSPSILNVLPAGSSAPDASGNCPIGSTLFTQYDPNTDTFSYACIPVNPAGTGNI